MPTEGLNGLGATAQLIIMGLAAVFIAAGTALSYFKSARKEAAGTGVILTGDSAELGRLIAALERLRESTDRLDADLRLTYDATRDLREEGGKLRATMATQIAMPGNEDLLLGVRRILERLDKLP